MMFGCSLLLCCTLWGVQAQTPAEPDAETLATLARDADNALETAPFSVMDKTGCAPSGDRHDYFSLSPYHWPNPDTPDGKPYVYRDGSKNPEVNGDAYDRVPLFRMTDTVETLCTAYRYSRKPAYAEHAARLLRAWFLDPNTRMNPNLVYAEHVMGAERQPPWGVIRGVRFVRLAEAVDWLDGAVAWSQEDEAAWQAWLADYLAWLMESDKGKKEARAWNNHGTWYDVQVAALALRCRKRELARNVLTDAGERRIASHIRPDGKQPKELSRAKSWDYSVMNLAGLFQLATLAQQVDVDLWHYETEDGRSLRGALDYLAGYIESEQPWPHSQNRAWEPERLYPLLRRAEVKYAEPRYGALAASLRHVGGTAARDHLLHPHIE